jgi:integrase
MTMTKSNGRYDPARRCMPLNQWPAADRLAWQAGTADGSLLTDAGLAARWRQGTRDRVVQSYGRFLGYLAYHGILDRDVGPADRVFRDRVIAYGEQLRRQCAPVTVHGYILNLERVLSVMAPDEDWAWLARLAARLQARARPSRDKRRRVVPAEELADLGHRLMDSAFDLEGLSPMRRAVRLRDGLMISLMVARMLRLRSFTGLEIGQHIIPADGGYQILLAPEDTKNGRPYEAPVPEWLVPYMDIYLKKMRPVLLGERCSDRLWISVTGADMSDSYINHRLCKVTARELGRPVNPHLFRDCAMTSRAIDDPDNVRAMPPVLGHSDMQTSERHYNQADAIKASRQHQANRAITRRRSRKK